MCLTGTRGRYIDYLFIKEILYSTCLHKGWSGLTNG
nr:MAG TPA: hypothetical protein [Bacteriophage sp.]